MEITIGMKFKKPLGKKYIECEVIDIFDIQSVSRKTGNVNKRVVYYAKSDSYGMEKSFEVAKTTILRGL